MATSSTSHTTATDAATQLAQIQRDLNRIQQQRAQQNSGIKVQEFEKDTRDVKVESNATTRNIGTLKANQTRLNLFSALSPGDRVDGYQFRVTDKTATTFSILNATQDDKDKLHFQIFYKSSGRVLADSDPKSGAANTVFQSLQDGTFAMEKGDYILRVTRADLNGPDKNKEFSYAVQLSQGLFTQDYDTVERASQAGDDPFGIGNVSQATNTLTGSLASSVSFMQSLPKIGTSATDKLMGLIINSLS
jgi:hypothetical protein